jgi:hypothetical protein
MNHFTVRHYLDIYRTRLRMQENGITKPARAIKELTRTIVGKLSSMPPDEIILLKDHTMMNDENSLIAAFPELP